jgi:membrane protein
VKNRLQRFARLWIDLFDHHELRDHASERRLPVRYGISFGLAARIALGVIGALVSTVLLGEVKGSLEVVTQVGRWILAIALLAVALGLLVRFGAAKHRSKMWISAGRILVIVSWIAATLIFELFVTEVANFKTATGELAVFLFLIGYVYTSSIILLVGVELDELLREDTAGQRGVLHVLFGYGK